MDFVLQPWHVYLLILVGWVQRQQQEVIHYLIAENRVLKEQIGKKRILLNDDQRFGFPDPSISGTRSYVVARTSISV